MNTKAAGKAKLDAQFTGPSKGDAVRDFEIINNHDGTHTVKYTPVQQVSILNVDNFFYQVLKMIRTDFFFSF